MADVGRLVISGPGRHSYNGRWPTATAAIRKDIAAVHTANLSPWSNSQVTRLKLVKRRM